MNNFWVGLKNKKGIFLAILALFTVTVALLDNHHQAYAEYFTEDYRYSVADCKDGGFEYQPANGGNRGCKVNIPEIKDGKVGKTTAVTAEGPNFLSKYPSYVLNDGGSCFQGYSKKDYNGINVCEKKGKGDKSTAYPKGRSTKDNLGPDECKKIGGYWGWGGNLGNRQASEENCYLNDMKGEPQGYNNMSSLPSKYLTAGDCAKGYEKSKKTQLKDFTEKGALWGKSKRGVYTCAKKGTKAGDNVEKCNKKENEDSEECKNNPAGEDDGDSDGSKDKNSCAIEWVGWIMCPVIRGANGMVVSTYSVMQQHFLNIKADEIFQQDKPAFKTWSSFRDIANVFFVIILSIIIFSQVSGVGISNYGIKKMLPKIIVFAILVNISWYISVIMIDISNIVGHSLFEWLSGDGTWQFSSDSQSEDSPVEQILGGSAVLVGTAAAVTGAFAAGTSILLFLFSAALALIMMVFILLIRQAAVIVLVVVSPVAFVAGILPNTEGFFKKWMKFLKNMLMIYPICSLIVGGSIFVSNLLYNNESSPLLKVAYGLLPILSLFTIVAIIKSVLSIIDGLTGGNLRGTLDRMSGKLTNATANSRPMRRVEEFQRNLKVGGLALGKDAREAKYQANKANRTYIRNRRDLNRLLNKDNQTAADFRQITRLGGEIGAHEKAQSEGMVSAMTTAIGGNVGNVAGQLRMVASATDPDQQRLMYGALSQAVTNAGLGVAGQSSALGDIVDSGLNTSDAAQRQAIMSQIASKSGADMKKVNPAAAKAATQNIANKDNIKSVSDFEKEVSTYAGASAQQMAGWSAMSSSNTADNKALDAMKNAFASGDKTQIGHAQSMGKVADQALNANSKGTMFLTPDQQKNFQAMSNLAKEHDPAGATSSSASAAPAPAPVSSNSENMKVGVNYSINSNSQASQYGAPAPTQQVAVDQYKSNRRFGPQRSK
jgi:hypothetical protein cdiviTM7_02854